MLGAAHAHVGEPRVIFQNPEGADVSKCWQGECEISGLWSVGDESLMEAGTRENRKKREKQQIWTASFKNFSVKGNREWGW